MGKNIGQREKSQDASPEAKIPLDLFKGIMHSLPRFEFVRGDDEVLIFYDHEIEGNRGVSRNLTMPDLINWIANIHEVESFARGKRFAKAEIRTVLGI